MKKKFAILALIVAITVVFLSIAQFADAQGNFPMMKQKTLQNKSGEFKEMMERRFKNFPDTKMQGFIKSLNLSEEQLAKINKIMLDFQKASLELNSKVQIKELEVRALMLESQTDIAKVRAKLEEIASLQVEVKVKALENYLKIKELLTPEQLAKLPLGVPMQRFGVENFGFNRMFKGNCW